MGDHQKHSRKSGRGKRGSTGISVVLVLLSLLVLGCAFGVMAVARIETVYPNVSLDGHDIGGLSDIALSELLFEKGYETVADNTLTVQLPLDYRLNIHSQDVCRNTSVREIVEKVMDSCHGGSRLDTTLRYLRCRYGDGLALSSGSVMSVDEAAVRAYVDNAVREVNLSLLSSDVKLGEKSICVVKGATAVTLDAQELSAMIVKAFTAWDFTPLVYEGQIHQDNELDLQSVYNNIYCEPKDAYYDPESGEIVADVWGVSFDLVSAAQSWNAAEYGQQVEIPLQLKEAEMSAAELEALLFRDNFCKLATSLTGSDHGRTNNVVKAAAAVDGIVLMPGEEFSYNEALGERTAENGYLPAGAYSDGQTVQEYGGGICQISSAVYYCALKANLKITSRTCHYFPVAYVPAGLDATVSWGGPEFKFVNNREYPVKLRAYVEDQQAVVEIWGTDVDGSYVEMSYETELVYDKEYTDVAIGYKAVSYRHVYDKDGALLSKQLEARSFYNYHEEDIDWPEEEEEENPEQLPEQEEVPEEGGSTGVEEEPAIEYEPWLDPANNG